ncbi:hypothetical protein AgCh_025325 [Apium graveolens]
MQAEEEEHEARMRMSVAYLRHQQRANSGSHHGGSTMNHRVIDRNREEGHARLYRDYFSDIPTYTNTQFRRRFRMRRPLFLRIEEAVTTHDNYFTQRTDAVGMRGLSSLQKVTAALRMLAYGTTADAVDDYVRIGEKPLLGVEIQEASQIRKRMPGVVIRERLSEIAQFEPSTKCQCTSTGGGKGKEKVVCKPKKKAFKPKGIHYSLD